MAVILIAGARFMVFTTLMRIQKSEFQRVTLNNGHHGIKKLFVKVGDLYKNSQNVQWEESNTELVLNGVYYEVVTIKKQGEHYLVDLAEDFWENDLYRMFYNMEDAKEELPQDVLADLEMDFFMPSFQTFQTHTNFIEHHTLYLVKETAGHSFRDVKPPWFCKYIV